MFSDHWSCWSPPGVPNASTVPSSRSARDGVNVVRGRRPGISDAGRPGCSQNICARVPRQKPSAGDRRRALEPAAARRRGDEVAEAVGDVEVAGVAAGRLAEAGAGRGQAGDVGQARVRPARPQLVGGLAGDQRAPVVRVLARQQELERDRRAVPVPGLAVGERELRALDHRVDVVGPEERPEVDAVEQRELLEEDRALTPRAGLEYAPAAEVERDRLLDRGAERGQIVAGEDLVIRHRLGDPAAVEGVARSVDSRFPRRSRASARAARTCPPEPGCAAASPPVARRPTARSRWATSMSAIAVAIPGMTGNPSRA